MWKHPVGYLIYVNWMKESYPSANLLFFFLPIVWIQNKSISKQTKSMNLYCDSDTATIFLGQKVSLARSGNNRKYNK